MSRPSDLSEQDDEDTRFMEIADAVSTKSTCIRAKYGSILTRHGLVLSTGYNRCLTNLGDEPLRCDREQRNVPHGTQYEIGDCLHSEMDVILDCARRGVSCEGATMYVNGIPCSLCARQIAISGISRLVVRMPASPEVCPVVNGVGFLIEAGLDIVILSEGARARHLGLEPKVDAHATSQ